VSILRIVVVAAMVIGGSHPARAQSQTATNIPISHIMDIWVTRTEQLLVPAADALPEPLFDFRPAGDGFRGVRSFGEQVKHLAAANYQLGSRVLGEQPPAGTHDETAPDSVRTKAQIMEYLRGSFRCLHRAADRVSESNLDEPIAVGRDTQTGVGLLIDAIAHSQNHYGQMVEYLRMNGIVPPASR